MITSSRPPPAHIHREETEAEPLTDLGQGHTAVSCRGGMGFESPAPAPRVQRRSLGP